MSKENIPKVYVGIDISKDHLDVCLMTGDQRLTLNNDAKGLDQWGYPLDSTTYYMLWLS